jgi:hypothetical protein
VTDGSLRLRLLDGVLRAGGYLAYVSLCLPTSPYISTMDGVLRAGGKAAQGEAEAAAGEVEAEAAAAGEAEAEAGGAAEAEAQRGAGEMAAG